MGGRGMSFLTHQYYKNVSAFLIVLFSFTAFATAFGGATFYRIIEDQNPGPEKQAIDEFLYGARVLYTGDAIPGKSNLVDGIVWHDTLEQALYFIGRKNPTLEGLELMKALSNDKWEEAKLLMEYAPTFFPKTENMKDVLTEFYASIEKDPLSPVEILKRLKDFLDTRYPGGFFMKPIDGFNSVGTFPTSETDFPQVYEKYLREVKPEIEKFLKQSGDPVETHLKFKTVENYSGRVLEALLKSPRKIIIQEKIKIKKEEPVLTQNGEKIFDEEYRVHIVQGKVLKGATVHRWEDANSHSEKTIARVETFAQTLIDLLPEAYRILSYGLDIVVTQDGGFKLIEMNTGGESGYFQPEVSLKITHLLASHFIGEPTEVLRELEEADTSKTLKRQLEIINDILQHPELLELKNSPDEPLSEIYIEIRKSILRSIQPKISEDIFFFIKNMIERLDFTDYFSHFTVSHFATRTLRKPQPRPILPPCQLLLLARNPQ